MKRRMLRVIAGVAVVGACAAFGAPSGGAETPPVPNSTPGTSVAAGRTVSFDSNPDFTLPLPPSVATTQFTAGLAQTTRIAGSKMTIDLPQALLWAAGPAFTEYPPEWNWNPSYPRRPPKVPLPEQFQSEVPGCIEMTTANNFVPGLVYAINDTPGGQPVGEFPPATVTVMAFGSIPVTAIVHLSQNINGTMVPLRAVQWIIGGGPTVPGPACDPGLAQKQPYVWNTVTGQLAMTLSDVTVDGQSLDVGTDCHTVAPLDLNLWSTDNVDQTTGGYAFANGGYLYQWADDSRVPVPGGYLYHPGSTDLTIPAFADCRDGSRDLSALITATVSGSHNRLEVYQGWGGPDDLDNLNACSQNNLPSGQPITVCPATDKLPQPVILGPDPS